MSNTVWLMAKGSRLSDAISNRDTNRLEELIAEGLDPNANVSFQHD